MQNVPKSTTKVLGGYDDSFHVQQKTWWFVLDVSEEDEEDDRVVGDGRRQQQSGRDSSLLLLPENDLHAGLGSIGPGRPLVSIVSYIRWEKKRWCLRTRRKTETAAANEITTFPSLNRSKGEFHNPNPAIDISAGFREESRQEAQAKGVKRRRVSQ